MKRLNTHRYRSRFATQGSPGLLKKRSQLRPLFLGMGPVGLCIISVVLIGLMAVLYLSQVGQGVDTNRQLQQLRQQQSQLTRQNQDLAEQLAEEKSPGYIAEHARQQGLQPADPKNVHAVTVPGLQANPDQSQP